MNVVTSTIKVAPVNKPSLKTPVESPIWAKIRPTSPRGIMPTPITVLLPLNQKGAYPANSLPITPVMHKTHPTSSARRPWGLAGSSACRSTEAPTATKKRGTKK